MKDGRRGTERGREREGWREGGGWGTKTLLAAHKAVVPRAINEFVSKSHKAIQTNK